VAFESIRGKTPEKPVNRDRSSSPGSSRRLPLKSFHGTCTLMRAFGLTLSAISDPNWL
jgi:hypothetical protein